ncbi:MAG: PhoU domain-containing protein [Thermoplasmatota archaeon]|jgi:phosphate uptake regulator
MEIRRVQVTGGSSYVLTLPKEWIKSLKIKKNDPLGIYVQSDGTLLVTPKMIQESTQRFKEIVASPNTKQSCLLRSLIAAYISGFTLIKIISPTRMSPSILNVIRTFTLMAIGHEVIEETDTTIILKDLLNPAEMSFDRTIKRMHIIVKGVYEDLMKALQSKNLELINEITLRENEIDRLNWLIARQYNIILQNISLTEKMEITTNFATTCFLISRIIERIADHTVKISENIPILLNSKLNKKSINQLINAGYFSLDIFNKSITSFFKKDIHSCNENIESVNKLEKICEEINAFALEQKGSVALSIGYFVDSVIRIGEYAEDISETVINYLINEKNK